MNLLKLVMLYLCELLKDLVSITEGKDNKTELRTFTGWAVVVLKLCYMLETTGQILKIQGPGLAPYSQSFS